MSEETRFRKGTLVLHTKKSYVGIVRFNLGARADLLTPRGVVARVKAKNLIPLQEAALQAAHNLPVGSVGLDNTGDLWTKTEGGWKGALYKAFPFDEWFSSSMARIYPAIPKNGYISKKEASCVGS